MDRARPPLPPDATVADPDFASVLGAAQAGEPWACEDLWRRYAPPVAAYLRARGSREPEDLTSEVFLAVFSGLGRFTGDEGGLRAFVFTIAHRRLVDELRMRRRRGDGPAWTQESDPRRATSAEDGALRSLGDRQARELLDGLPVDQRNVLVLRIIADLTVEQVAAVLGKRPGAVKALQRRGLESLRKKTLQGRTLLGPVDDMEG